MRLLLVFLALAAVAATTIVADVTTFEESVEVTVEHSWREKAIEHLQKAIARLEEAVDKLPEGSRLKPILNRTLQFLRKKLTDLQDAEITFNDVNRTGILQQILENLEEAASKLPEGAAKELLLKSIEKIRAILNKLLPAGFLKLDKKNSELVNQIRNLIEKHKAAGKEDLLKFLNSDVLEKLIGQLPQLVQNAAREQIAKLKERLESKPFADEIAASLDKSKVIEFLEKAIARLEEAIAKLPEGSKALDFLKKRLDALKKKLDDLKGSSFSRPDLAGILKRALARLEEAAAKLPEGAAKERLQKAIEKIRERLDKLKPESDEFAASLDKSKVIEFLEKAIARLEEAIAKLPEGSKALDFLKKRLDALKKKLDDLKGSV